MTRARITALALILAVGTWGPISPARAGQMADAPPPPRLSRHQRATLAPVAAGSNRLAPNTPHFGPPQWAAVSKLAFQSYRDGNWEIYLANGDGTGETRITNHSASDVLPRLTRGADRVVFVSNRDGNSEIYSVRSDGGDVRRLTNHGAADTSPAWSPDGNKIAFSSNRDGNSELYVMNRDGTGVTRLTNHSATDGEPAWSPDGARIAFVSDRASPANTGGRIWTMNADGSNPQQIGVTNFSFDPVWSPDGTKIAFDGDYNGDGWLDTLWMNAAGGPVTVLFYGNSSSYYEYYMGAWSPDSAGVTYTIAFLVWTNNQWYLNAVAVGYQPLGENAVYMTTSMVDMNPDWQSADLTPPTTAVQALPAVSPADFTVTWAGSATDGPAQQIGYEVQSREGLTGTWAAFAYAPWNTPSTKSFHGLGGRTYYFRSRGIDNATNIEAWPADADAWTTVEALPPMSSMTPLESYTRAMTLALQWSGTDPGGSGIASYDVEYRAGELGAWTRYLTGTTSTSAAFPVARGNIYSFRARATDAAENIEDWPPGDGDTQSTIYAWRGTGHVFDVRGEPIESASAQIQRGGPPDTSTTDGLGAYTTILLTSTPTLSATWSKAGYGNLPATPFSVSDDLDFDVFLPPIDNIVAAPDFEVSTLDGTAWRAQGLPHAKSVTDTAHTGLRAAELGGLNPSLAINVSASISDSRSGQLAVDPSGAPHLVWLDTAAGRESIAHAERLPSGAWTTPEILSAGIFTSAAGDPARDKPAIAFDPAGTAHVVWRNSPPGEAYYVNRPVGGAWSAPLMIASGLSPANSSALRLAVSVAGRVHVAWHAATAGRSDIYYRSRDAAGVWEPLENVTGGDPFATAAAYPEIGVDAAEIAHLAWQNGIGYYASRPVSGSWSAPVGVTVWPFLLEQTRLSVDAAGQARAAWLGHAPGVNAIVYATIEGGSATATQLAYTSTQALSLTRLLIDGSGQSQLGWSRGDGEVLHASKGAGGWTSTNVSASPSKTSSQMDLLSTTSGLWAVWREQESAGAFAVACKKRTLDGQWHALNACAGALAGLGDPALAAGPDNRAHLAFGTPGAGAAEQYYTFWDDAGPRGAGLAQSLDIIPAVAGPVLSFLYRLDIPAGEQSPVMTVSLESGPGVTVVFTTALSTTGAWTHVWRDLSAWSGQAVTLAFQLDPMSGAGRARLLLDEVNIGSLPADTWLTAHTAGHAPPGGQVIIDVAYGNHGAGVAHGVALTAALPAELTFVAAEPAPISTSPLAWQLPDMASNAGPFAIQITTTVDGGATPGSNVTITVNLATSATEVELANNQSAALLFVGYRAHLPMARR